MLETFQKHINQNLAFLNKSKLLIAVSGGMDSLALTHLCHELKLNIALAHCNFNLRGKESDADEDFVLQLAEKLNLETFIQNFETEKYAKKHKLSTQMAARELRYDWFSDLVGQLGFDYVLTAHHIDDDLETFLINLSRGTGLEGLTGIPEVNNFSVRPLLAFSRGDIEEYAKNNDIKWREDSSNASTKYLRNQLRHEVIPKLKDINPQLLNNFKATQNHLNDTKQIVEDAVSRIQKKIVSVENDIIQFNIKKLKKLSNPKAYLYELLKDFNFTEWNDVTNLLEAQSGKQVFSETHRLIRNREYLLLSSLGLEENQIISILETNQKVETPFGILFFDEADALFGKRTNIIHVDKSKLNFPLTLRKWEEGDVFYPFGMEGKKKLSKFFKDEKLSILDKENVWLLCSSNDIVWIVNRRADDRFKVTDTTKQSLKIELHQ